jgi:predicted metal-binding protein
MKLSKTQILVSSSKTQKRVNVTLPKLYEKKRKMPSYVHIIYQTNAVKVTERMIPCIRACHAAYKATNAHTYLLCVSYGIKLMSEKQDKINCRSTGVVTNDRTLNILQ